MASLPHIRQRPEALQWYPWPRLSATSTAPDDQHQRETEHRSRDKSHHDEGTEPILTSSGTICGDDHGTADDEGRHQDAHGKSVDHGLEPVQRLVQPAWTD